MGFREVARWGLKAGKSLSEVSDNLDRLEELGITVITADKGPERYVIAYTQGNRNEALRTLGRWASDPLLSFTWYDAAKASQIIRRET